MQGDSSYVLANKYNTHRINITRLLKKMDINIRSNKRNINIPTKLIQKLNGWMLGDGGLFSTGIQGNFVFSSKHKEYIDYVSSCFEESGMTSKQYQNEQFGKTYYRLRTVSTVELGKLYNDWYKNRVKIVPEDLELSDSCIRHWIMDDGTLSKQYGHLRLCTNSFTENECEILAEKMNRFVGSTEIQLCDRGKNTTRIYIPKKDVLKLYNKIGTCDVACFKYKWEVASNSGR